MLNEETVQRIEEFVFDQPRSIQEIAQHLGRNWRTADRYVEEIRASYGTISTRTFRGGTRGALKVVYWAAVEKIKGTVFQERLEQEILAARRKEDFSAFDIFQHVDAKKANATVEKAPSEDKTDYSELVSMLRSAKKNVLIFSGNLSFINTKTKNVDLRNELESIAKRNIPIKILCRVDLAGKKNVETALNINFITGKELVQIHHREHPLR
jgi:hypothetical protein